MTGTKIRLLRIALAAVVGVGCLFVSEKVSLIKSGSLVTEAHAVIGRPLTPMSYAGVARRTTRARSGCVLQSTRRSLRGVYGAPVYAAPCMRPSGKCLRANRNCMPVQGCWRVTGRDLINALLFKERSRR